MRFNFRKIASAAASAAMVSATVGLAAAANYPAPFVQGGTADVAIVYGSTAASSDLVAATDITSNLATALAAQDGDDTTATIEGEAYPLFTGSSPLLINASINAVKETLADTELPTLLEDGNFEGDVSATIEGRITIGNNPVIKYASQPSDDDDPQLGIALGTSPRTQYLFNASIVFDKVVNFTHADSEGEKLTIFGQEYTVSSATDTTKLVLFGSSETLFLSSTSNPSQTVVIDGETFTVELVAASDTSATIRVTDSTGASDQKEVNEASSKKIQGLEIGVNNADESTLETLGISAEVLVGASRITLQDGNSVKVGTDEDLLDGTNVEFEDGSGSSTTYPGNISEIIFQVAAEDSQNDAIVPGQAYIDPIFGTVKVDFIGLSVPEDGDDREAIEVRNSGNDKMVLTFTSHEGDEATINWVYNKTDSQAVRQDLADSDGDAISVDERGLVNQSGYVVLASDDEGGIYEVVSISNSSSTTASDDKVVLRNVVTGAEIDDTATTEGSGTFSAQGREYTYTYYGANGISNSKAMQLRINHPESSGNNLILFPTVATSKGAKLAFYEPLNISLDDYDGAGTDVAGFLFQNGNGYTTVTIAINTGGGVYNGSSYNITVGSTTSLVNSSQSQTATIGKLKYNFTTTGSVASAVNRSQIFLTSPDGGNIVRPAISVIEEQDDANNYEAFVFTTDAGYDGDSAGIGVSDVVRTVENDAGSNFGNEIQLETNTDLYKDIDLWGTIFQLDKSDSDQTTATVWYPDNQVEALLYVAETGAISSSSSGGELGSVTVMDSEASQVSAKNLIVIGGSCVNSVAATLLGSDEPLCGADFEAATGVGSGSFLIQSFESPLSGSKIALLVAGYNAADTTNAAKALTTQTIDTAVGKKYTGSSSDSVTSVA